MDETEIAKGRGTAAPGARTDDRLSGRLGIMVGGKTVAALHMEGGGATLEPADGDTRASVLVTSMDDLQRIARGELNLVVASLRGLLSLRGDLTFGVRALRALEAGIPVQGADRNWTRNGG
jgi:putative sterol carrier protein